MPNPHSLPGLRSASRSRNWAGPVVVALLSATVFGWDLAAEPHFVDESAYISQSFYADLWLAGRWDDPTWICYAGYDLPPMPKYVIGLALRAADYRRPGPLAMAAWYEDTRSRFVPRAALVVARRPSVAFGVLGCMAAYALGAMALDRRLGLAASLLLMANPLYAMHARRAMSDVPAESLILAGLAVGLWAFKQILGGRSVRWPVAALVLGSGVLGGLATLSKLNGALGGFTLGAWAVLALALPGLRARIMRNLLLATFASGVVSFATFAALNPFLFAHPTGPPDPATAPIVGLGFVERVKVVANHRVGVSDRAKSSFPDDALTSPLEKVKAVVVQGLGRFGPLGPRGWTDSTLRFDWEQDRGAWVWGPIVALGLLSTLTRGWTQIRSGEVPAAWAVTIQAVVALAVVTAFIPLAWDRYYLSIQPALALVGGFAVVEAIDLVRPFLAGRQAGSEPNP